MVKGEYVCLACGKVFGCVFNRNSQCAWCPVCKGGASVVRSDHPLVGVRDRVRAREAARALDPLSVVVLE